MNGFLIGTACIVYVVGVLIVWKNGVNEYTKRIADEEAHYHERSRKLP